LLTPLQAFDAMRAFLERFWVEGDKQEEDIACLLGSLNRSVWGDRGPADPAHWGDWQEALETVLKNDGSPLDDPLADHLKKTTD